MSETPWESRYAQRTQRMKSSAIRELLKLTEQPEIISFGGGLPAPDVFPVEEFIAASEKVLREHGAQALQYGPTEGYRPLREMIVRYVARSGIDVTLDNIMITSGSQQALDLIGKILINPGDRVVVENPTYLGALQAWNAYGAEYVPVPLDDDGMDTSYLEEALRTGPKFIYALPNFQNPTGCTLSQERRERLIELAERYGVPIVEDDPYGQLRYEGESMPTLAFMDNARHPHDGPYHGNVIYMFTFSKILSPGIRLGWVMAPAEVISKLVMAKQGTDLQTSSFTQMVAYEVAHGGFLDRQIERIQTAYRVRRDVMLSSLRENMPPGVTWSHPNGGLFLFLRLPSGMNSTKLLEKAVTRKVAFVPGDSFYPCGGGENTMRINFSNASEEMIRVGVARLADAIREEMGVPEPR